MYCPQCGQANDDDVKYCTQCGNDLERYREEWWEGKTPPAATGASAPAGAAGPAQTPGATAATGAAPPSGQVPPGGYTQPGGYVPPGGHTPPGGYPPPPGYPPPYGQPYPPAYAPPAYYQPAPYHAVPNIPSYMGWAIATLILCFWPTGIVAVVYASKVGNRLALGDIAGAQEASRKAKMWCWITFAIGIAAVVIAIVASILLAAAATITVY